MIGFSNIQFLMVLATYVLLGAVLGAVPGVLLAAFLKQSRRTVVLDATIGICGILVGLVAGSWASLRVTFWDGHGVGPRGFLDEYGLLLASCVAVGVVVARHARLRLSPTTSW